jgi:hypothetical protein
MVQLLVASLERDNERAFVIGLGVFAACATSLALAWLRGWVRGDRRGPDEE